MHQDLKERPRLYYPWPDLISPYVDELEEEINYWLLHSYRCIPPDIKRKYEKTQLGHITARFFPMASRERLTPLNMNSLWGIAFDDYHEHCTIDQLRRLKHRVEDILIGAPPLKEENDIFWQLAVMRDSFAQFMPTNWLARFSNSMGEYVQGMVEEAPFKQRLISPSLSEYMEIRMKAVDVYPLVSFAEVVIGYTFPREVIYHPLMRRLADLTCRIVAWCNDYFSIWKEEDKDIMNIIMVVQHEYDISREEAFAEAVRIHQADVDEYINLCNHMPHFGIHNEKVKEFIHHNNLMIQGHKSWYEKDTQRYKPGGHPEADQFRGVEVVV
ncbi:hypothetical protein AAHN97_12000 [Chitinophaga niabensis]|uniref:terpene synthase family protein n=1 Tax=Chitinophaga niabensis TaxID=536979 RepID=UPI0031BADA61